MHPGFAYWWRGRGRHAGACGDGGSCGPEAHAGGPGHHHHGGPPPWAGASHFGGGGFDDGDFGGGSFGVRRPLRFLAHKLELNEEQVAELARILDDLKTERAQGAVDHRRTTAAFADAIGSESFDEAKVAEAADTRVKSADRLRVAVVKALGRIHKLLDAEQRAKLAYLLRTGALAI
ncbi:MAG: Spy/CpxP family protein refolding chaperone [Polyangiaceae bacterium]